MSQGLSIRYAGAKAASSSRPRNPHRTPTVSIPAFLPVSISVLVSPKYRQFSGATPISFAASRAPLGSGFFGILPALRPPCQRRPFRTHTPRSSRPGHGACWRPQPASSPFPWQRPGAPRCPRRHASGSYSFPRRSPYKPGGWLHNGPDPYPYRPPASRLICIL